MQPEEIIDAELVNDDQPKATQPQPSKARLVEQILSPQSLQWMMLCGGGILVLGFVVWLWSVGVFEHPLVVSGIVGAATLSLLGAGVAMVRFSRYQLAGRGVALLGSIALPLNLWLYDAQGLVTLADGGHLWIPAALFCLIYAAVARVLRDSTFVYALVGGVVITGMLFLADQSIGRLWALMPPVTFLVVIGWLSAFADRLFVDDDGDFSRKNFGLAFHRAGLVVVTAGLTLLLGGHIAAAGTYLLSGGMWPLIATSQPQKLWALGVIGTSAIGFVLQSMLHKSRLYRGAAMLLVAWAVPATLDFFSIELTVSQVAIAFSLLVLTGNLLVSWVRVKNQENDSSTIQSLAPAIRGFSQPVVGALAVLAFGQLIAQSLYLGNVAIFSSLGWVSTLQILTAGLAACASGWNCRATAGDSKTDQVLGYLSLGVGSVLVIAAAWSGVFVQVFIPVQIAAALVMLVPVALAVVTVVVDDRQSKSVLQNLAVITMTTHLVIRGAVQTFGSPTSFVIFNDFDLQWSVILAIASGVYWLASMGNAKSVSRVLSYAAATFSLATLAHFFGFEFGYCLVVAPMIVGFALRVFESITAEIDEAAEDAKLSGLAMAANFLVLGSGIGGVLLALSRWVDSGAQAGSGAHAIDGTLMLVMLTLLACTTVVSLLTKHVGWRTTFRALIVGLVGASLCVFDGWLNIDGWQRLELCSIVGGAILLGLGHLAWSREDAKQDDAASAALGVGSLLVALPLAIGLLSYRLGFSIDSSWMQFHEVTAIVAGLILFGSGICCKLRATTISGAALLGIYLVSLITLINLPDKLQSVSVMMMVGGGLFFATAFLMSIYRDRLISLPRRIREGEGVYRILKWR